MKLKMLLIMSLLFNALLLGHIVTNSVDIERVSTGSDITLADIPNKRPRGGLSQFSHLLQDDSSTSGPSSDVRTSEEAEVPENTSADETIRAAFEAFGREIEKHVEPDEELYLADKELQEAAKYYSTFTSEDSFAVLPITKEIDRLWKIGKFEDGLRLAKARLNSDDSDLIGLLVKLEYYAVNHQYDLWAKTGSRIFSVSQSEQGPSYEKLKSMCLSMIRMEKGQLEKMLLANSLPSRGPETRRRALFHKRAFVASLETDTTQQ